MEIIGLSAYNYAKHMENNGLAKFNLVDGHPYNIPTKYCGFDDILLLPQPSDIKSRVSDEISTRTKFGDIHHELPIISAPMDSVTGPKLAITMQGNGGLGVLHRFQASIEEWRSECYEVANICGTVETSVGISDEWLEALVKLDKKLGERNQRLNGVAVDVANGYMSTHNEFVRQIRNRFPYLNIIGGSVCTYKGAADQINAGVNIIRCGIGPGSCCTTRQITGIGMPQVNALIEARRALDTLRPDGGTLIADGGIRNSGDIIKALALGADSVMLGRLLAGTDESAAPVCDGSGKLFTPEILDDDHFVTPYFTASPLSFYDYKIYRGQSSENFQKDNGIYREQIAAEGVTSYIPRIGPTKSILTKLIGGVRSGMSYVGAHTLKDLRDKAVFIEITQNAYQEGLARK